MQVIKIGGNQLDDEEFLRQLGETLARLDSGQVIVHGGGRGTTELCRQLGIEPRFLDGLRVTDEPTLEATIMGLVGKASLQVVQALVRAGVPALGLCGADAGLVTARKLDHPGGDLGRVGVPSRVDWARLKALLDSGFLPCIAPVCLDETGRPVNVNADHVAAAVAAELKADRLVFVTATPGVLVDGSPCARLSRAECRQLIRSGVIQDGMVPKVESALQALASGVASVLITNLEGLEQLARGQSVPTELAA
ncbi:MAG: acetylglutamate kinase [Armatimonadetes bacterium]|nr:acetylglutamate kinase [Armatimonadota bacterium]